MQQRPANFVETMYYIVSIIQAILHVCNPMPIASQKAADQTVNRCRLRCNQHLFAGTSVTY